MADFEQRPSYFSMGKKGPYLIISSPLGAHNKLDSGELITAVFLLPHRLFELYKLTFFPEKLFFTNHPASSWSVQAWLSPTRPRTTYHVSAQQSGSNESSPGNGDKEGWKEGGPEQRAKKGGKSEEKKKKFGRAASKPANVESKPAPPFQKVSRRRLSLPLSLSLSFSLSLSPLSLSLSLSLSHSLSHTLSLSLSLSLSLYLYLALSVSLYSRFRSTRW
jgi:hypothetical protein